MPLSVRVSELQEKFSHDVLTVQEASNRSFSDESVVAFATAENQAVLTLNRKDFIIIHRTDPNYAGIIVCSLYR